MFLPAIRFVWLLAAIFLTFGASRADEIVDRQFFRDGTGALGVDQVRSQQFQPFTGVLSAGFGKDTVWLRLTLRAEEAGNVRTRVVRVRPPILDQVTIYGPVGQAHTTGDLSSGSSDSFRSTNLNSKIDVPPHGGEIFIAIRSETARSILVEVLTLEEAATKDAIQLALIAAYCVLVLISALLALMHWSRFPEALFGWFVLRQFSELLYLVLNLGIVRYLLTDAPDRLISGMTNGINILYVGVSVAFVYVLISEYRAPRITHYAFRLILLLWSCGAGLGLAGFFMEALRLNILSALAATLVIFPAALSTAPQRRETAPVMPKHMMVAMCCIISASGGFAVIIQLGFFQNGLRNPELTLYAAHIHGLFTTTCMTAYMYARSIRLASQHVQSGHLLLIARTQAEQDRKSREEQEKLLSMLAHELRTPMSVMKMNLGPRLSDVEGMQELRLAIDDMASVLDKTVQAVQMSGEAMRLDVSAFDLKDELYRASTRLEGLTKQIDADGIGEINNDVALIRIVLNNLVENALKYGSHDAPVIIKARHDDRTNSLRLSAVNTRSEYGLPDPDTVFDKYYRGPHAHRKSGSGLGLFIVDMIAKRFGGNAFFEQDGDLVEFGIVVPADLEQSLPPSSQKPAGIA